MEVVYHNRVEKSTVFARRKSTLDRLRRPGEVVVPMSDTQRTFGWMIMPIGEYVRARYISKPNAL